MNSSTSTNVPLYTDCYGKPITDDIDRLFSHGIKPTDRVSEREFCSRQQIFYIIVGVVWTIIFLIVTIIPAVIGTVTRNGR